MSATRNSLRHCSRSSSTTYHHTAYGLDLVEVFGEHEALATGAWGQHAVQHHRVGIGSLCGRNQPSEIAELVRVVAAVAEVLPGRFQHLGRLGPVICHLEVCGRLRRWFLARASSAVATRNSSACISKRGADAQCGAPPAPHLEAVTFRRVAAQYRDLSLCGERGSDLLEQISVPQEVAFRPGG
jgi:hypothetical protein